MHLTVIKKIFSSNSVKSTGVKAFLVVALGITGLKVLSQEYNKPVDNRQGKFKYYINGSFGFFFPNNTEDVFHKRGSYNSFSFQVNHKDDLFIRLFFDVSNINYEKLAVVDNLSMLIKDKVSSNFIGLDAGYNKSFGRFTPSVFIGTGLFTMDVPKINIDAITGTINFNKERKGFFAFRGGASIEYEVNRIFLLYLECSYLSIPYKTAIDDRHLKGLVFQIGFKTPLQ
jgi:hypothetical protein